jgi:hypothetical protein
LIDAVNITTEEYEVAIKGVNLTAYGIKECSLSEQLDQVKFH